LASFQSRITVSTETPSTDAVLPPDVLRVDEAQIGFVDEGRRLEAVAGALAGHAALRDAVELLFYAWYEPPEGRFIALPAGTYVFEHVDMNSALGMGHDGHAAQIAYRGPVDDRSIR
jgi:hypothetical protein